MSEREQFEQEQNQQNDRPEQMEQTVETETTEQTVQAEMTEQTEQAGVTEQSGQTEQIDNGIYVTPDVYQTQTAQEIYRMPDMTAEPEYHNTGGVFSGDQPAYDNNAPNYQSTNNNGSNGNDLYGRGQFQNGVYNSVPESNVYRTDQPESNAYAGSQPINNNDAYAGSQPINNNDTYAGSQPVNNNVAYVGSQPVNSNDTYAGTRPENNVYGTDPQYGNSAYGNSQCENNPYGKKPYGGAQPGNNAYGNDQNANNQYGNNQYGNNQYGNNQYGNQPYGSPYSSDSYGYNPYSPYAAPTQKKNTGLIIGVIVGIAILFLIAVFALLYHAIEVASEKKDVVQTYENDLDEFDRDRSEDDREDYFNDDRAHRDDEYDYNYDDDYDDDDYNYDDDYGYDDYDDYNYDDDEYYTLHDDIKDLSYTIDWKYYDYDANGDNVIITVEYPVIVKGRIPNQEKINDVLESEIGFFTDYYENEYSKYMGNNDSYFYASSVAYVTYMSEDVLSVVFSEAVYSDYFDSISLYCINIDVQNGVILDNTDILSVDDDFSVDFRYRSKKQNGSVDALDRMSDQEITEMLTSTGSLIIFYTPQGLEVGLNHENGYVTVTYHDEYKDYLNTF